MDLRERFSDPQEGARIIQDSVQGRMWTMLPGIVQSFSIENGAPFVSVQPAVKGIRVADDQTVTSVDLPLLPHCPVLYPRGGGCSLTFPIVAGDECMVVFGSRSIDEWWQNGEAQPAYDLRQHDLSDGIAIIGLTSLKRPLSNISTTSTQLRSDDGRTVIDLNASSGVVTITVPNGLNVVGPMHVTGPVTADSTITAMGDIKAGSISLEGHVHSGVQSGSGKTGMPL